MNNITIITGECISRFTSNQWRDFVSNYLGLMSPLVYGISFKTSVYDKHQINGRYRPIVIMDLFDGRYPTTIGDFMDELFNQIHPSKAGERDIIINTTSKCCMEYLLKMSNKLNFIHVHNTPEGIAFSNDAIEEIKKDFDIK